MVSFIPLSSKQTVQILKFQRRTVLTSHILLKLCAFLAQVSILNYGKKKTFFSLQIQQKIPMSYKKNQSGTGAIVTSSPSRAQLAVCAPCLPGCTTAFLFSNLHHLLSNSFTHVVLDDSKAKPLPRICKIKISKFKSI